MKGGNFPSTEHPVGGESHILLLAGKRLQSISCNSAHPNQTDSTLESSLEGSVHTMHVLGCPRGDTGAGRGWAGELTTLQVTSRFCNSPTSLGVNSVFLCHKLLILQLVLILPLPIEIVLTLKDDADEAEQHSRGAEPAA